MILYQLPSHFCKVENNCMQYPKVSIQKTYILITHSNIIPLPQEQEIYSKTSTMVIFSPSKEGQIMHHHKYYSS